MVLETWLNDTLNAIFESGVDRWGVGGVCRYVLPQAQRYLASAWRRCRPKLTAAYAAAKSAPVWRKAVCGLTLVWGVGGVMAYLATGGTDHAAPLWAMLWFGSLSAILWGYAGWQAVLWAARLTRRLLA